MKYEVKNRVTGEVQFVAEIECKEDALDPHKKRLAVIWALKNGADLSCANLRGANLRGADLYGANLSCADLSCADLSGAKGIIRIGPSTDGWEFFGVVRDGVVWITVGCHWFTAADARTHWTKTRGGTARGVERLAFVDFIETTMLAREGKQE